jgi:ankyrin repeat protein
LEAPAEGVPSLIMAVIGGKVDTVKVLLEAGADLDARTNFGTTALMAAKQVCRERERGREREREWS